MRLPGTVVLLLLLLAPAADRLAAAPGSLPDALRTELLMYAPFDGHLDLLSSTGLLLPAEFARAGAAYAPDWSRADAGAPRFVPGRFGRGVFLESGHYGDFKRGTENLLPAASSRAEGFPAGFESVAGASLGRDSAVRGPVSAASLRIACASAGQGAAARPARLPAAMRYIASAYLRGARGGEKVILSVKDAVNATEYSAPAVLTPEWRRFHVAVPYDERTKKAGEKALKEPSEAVFSVLAEGPATFHADALMLEQAGMHYSARMTPSTWIPGGEQRGSEVLNLPAIPGTFDPARGALSLWIRLDPGVFNRTYCAAGYGWETFINVGESAGRLVLTFWDKRVYGAPLSQGEWHHLAVAWEGGGARLYVDGAPVLAAAGAKADPASFAGRPIAVMPGNSASGGFSAKTHAGGVVDDICVFRRPLSDPEAAALAKADGPAVATDGVFPRCDAECRVYNRDLGEVALPFALRNLSARASGPVAAIFEVAGLLRQESAGAVDVPAGGAVPVTFRLPVERLAAGAYTVRVALKGGGDAAATLGLTVAPWRDRGRLPVLAWNAGGGRDELAAVADLGVTVAGTGTSPLHLDWAAEANMSGFAHLNLHGTPRPETPEDLVTLNDGRTAGPNPASARIRGTVRDGAVRFAERMKSLPNLTHVIVNTEWSSPMDFGAASRERARREFGIDLARWMTDEKKAWSYLHPYNRLNPTLLGDDWFPAGGVVAADDPFYRYHLWWHRGGGNEVAINEICAEEIKRVRPDAVTITEPILRAPPVKRYAKFDVAEEWFYYPDPLTAVERQESLACVAAGRGMKPSGMPQFLFKGGMAAPYAATPPPDMLREVVWLCVSRPLCMLSFWGWHRVLDPKGKMLPAEIEERFRGLDWKAAAAEAEKAGGEGGGLFIPEVKDEFARLCREVLQPFGPLFTAWANRPRTVAVVVPFASSLYGNERWPTLQWLGAALSASGIPYDVLYDESFMEDPGLPAAYRVVILPNASALHRTACDRIKVFAAAGGLVVADERCRVEGIPQMKVFPKERAEEAVAAIRGAAGLPVSCGTTEVVWNLLETDGASYLVAVNDKREPGPYFGRWQRVREKGVAQTASFVRTAALAGAVYDLADSREIAPAGSERFDVRLGPTEGRILLFLPERPERLAVAVRARAARGGPQTISVALTGRSGPVPGAVPCEIVVTEPSGRRHDRSCRTLLRKGRCELPLTVPVNAAAGEWKVAVRERATGLTAGASFTVD